MASTESRLRDLLKKVEIHLDIIVPKVKLLEKYVDEYYHPSRMETLCITIPELNEMRRRALHSLNFSDQIKVTLDTYFLACETGRVRKSLRPNIEEVWEIAKALRRQVKEMLKLVDDVLQIVREPFKWNDELSEVDFAETMNEDTDEEEEAEEVEILEPLDG